ncbi:NAD(P)/FAD-dependent oxidoreductase [Halovivax gelatinilyticus]|uniref:NAD(P)/FAD-dependent oxidoreductase n=1 Tax=Halovivax gelatinilyticus TaxID=2961597 RepID=UPI0020CA4A3D|nr:FAD-dependent oxidoreductase [Halovivax gelatinilyticus]
MHVVVLGGGYAGLTVARKLERTVPADVSLTLVNDSPDHVLQHELHRVIRRPAIANDITVSLASVLDRTTVHVATVESIDRERRTVTCSTGPIEYDYAVVCLGATTAFHGLEDVRERSTPLKRLSHARTIRRSFFASLETQAPRIVVGGAGLSGIQTAGELAALARAEGVPDRVEILLLEQAPRVAPGFPDRFQSAIRRTLTEQGVDVQTNAAVTGATDETIERLDDDPVRYDGFVWTGGIRGGKAMTGERPTVGSDLRLDDRTLACGDAARVVDADDEVVPASAQAATRQARTAAESVSRLIDGERTGNSPDAVELAEFRFVAPGWIVSVGDDAVATLGSRVITGAPARAAKATVGAGYLAAIGARARAGRLAASELNP